MKTNLILLSLVFNLIFNALLFGQGVSINNEGSDPDNSAILDVKSNNKGMLIPRMTQDQRNLIISPATGLMIYQTDINSGFYYYNGTQWIEINPEFDRDSTNELQFLSRNGDTLFLSKGNFVVFPHDDDRDSTNEIQQISIVDDSLYLSKNQPFKIYVGATKLISPIEIPLWISYPFEFDCSPYVPSGTKSVLLELIVSSMDWRTITIVVGTGSIQISGQGGTSSYQEIKHELIPIDENKKFTISYSQGYGTASLKLIGYFY